MRKNEIYSVEQWAADYIIDFNNLHPLLVTHTFIYNKDAVMQKAND